MAKKNILNKLFASGPLFLLYYLSISEIDTNLEKLFEVLSNIEKNDAADAESRMRLRSIDVQMLHLMEDLASGRQEITSAIRSELNSLSGVISEAKSKAKGKN